MSANQQKLPPNTDDHVIEVSLKHVVISFSCLVLGTLAVAGGIIFVRDYARYCRQKALIEAANSLVNNLITGGQTSLWNENKTDFLSTTTTSEKQKK